MADDSKRRADVEADLLSESVGDALKRVIDVIEKKMPTVLRDADMLQKAHGLSARDVAANRITRSLWVYEQMLPQVLRSMREAVEQGRRIIPFDSAETITADLVKH